MLRRLFTVVLVAAIACFFVTPAAMADDIVVNQWYSASFGSDIPSAVFGPGGATSINGPVLASGFADSVLAPAGTSWTITLTQSGTFTVTDLEISGDYFQVYDNGNLMSAASSPFTAPGQNPGQTSLGGGLTPAPCVGCSYEGEDINAALGDSNFSSATFALNSGVNVITINYLGYVAESSVTPEPSSLLLLGTGLIGVAGAIRRKLKI